MKLTNEKLDFWIKNEYNVLLIGKHGCGKSTIVIDAFERNNLKWKYFSASTLDPWVDFIGIPKEMDAEDGSGKYLGLIRPECFQNDEVEAIFIDEYNRGAKKIKNAIMELIQFKSINGKKFNNLKVIWAAINPYSDDDDYDVEKMDRAQEDRFHIHVNMPYEPNEEYFVNKYGKDLAMSGISWWNQLPDSEKDNISPRRLDYALGIYMKNGDLRDILPESSNVSKLISSINYGPFESHIVKYLNNNDISGAEKFLSDENNSQNIINYLLENSGSSGITRKIRHFYIPLMSKENISLLCASSPKIFTFILNNCTKQDKYRDVLVEILNSNLNEKLSNKIKSVAKKNYTINNRLGLDEFSLNVPKLNKNGIIYKSDGQDEKSLVNMLKDFGDNVTTIYDHNQFINKIESVIPSEFSKVENVHLVLDVMQSILTGDHGEFILNRFTNFVPVFNLCIKELIRLNEDDSMQWDGIYFMLFDKLGKKYYDLFDLIYTDNKLSSQLFLDDKDYTSKVQSAQVA